MAKRFTSKTVLCGKTYEVTCISQTDEEIEACDLFFKWFETSDKQTRANILFALRSIMPAIATELKITESFRESLGLLKVELLKASPQVIESFLAVFNRLPELFRFEQKPATVGTVLISLEPTDRFFDLLAAIRANDLEGDRIKEFFTHRDTP